MICYNDEHIYPITDLPLVIPVGVQTGKGTEPVRFYIRPWLEKWPGMTFEVWPTRPTETAAYLAVSHLDGDVLVWSVGDADTAIEGLGTVEVVGIAEGVRKPSGPCTTEIKKTSLGVTQDPPAGIKPYYEDMMEAAQVIREGLDDLNMDMVGSDGVGGLYIITCNGDEPNRTQEEIRAAVNARKTVLLRAGTRVYTYFQETQSSNYDEAAAGKTCPTFVRPARQEDGGLRYYEVQVHEDNTITDRGKIGKTPNPKKLKLTGAVEAEYDGSEEVNVELPESINNLLIVTTAIVDGNRVASHTPTEIRDAAGSDDKIVLLLHGQTVYTLDGTTTVDGALQSEFNGYAYVDEDRRVRVERATVDADSIVHRHQDVSRMYVPNPYALTLTGAVNATYDGKTAVTVEIPSGIADPGTAHQQLVSDAEGKAVWMPALAYKTTGQVEILPETALTYGGPEDGLELHLLTSPLPTMLEDGKTYTVNYNGTDYACPVVSADGGLAYVLGNASAIGGEGGNADAPFCFIAYNDAEIVESMGGIYVMCAALDGATSVTISITGEDEKIVKLPQEYYDQGDWNALHNEPGHILNRTHWEKEVPGGVMVFDPAKIGEYTAVQHPDGALTFYKISDIPINKDTLVGRFGDTRVLVYGDTADTDILASGRGENGDFNDTFEIDNITSVGIKSEDAGVDLMVVGVRKTGTDSLYSIDFPEIGTYVVDRSGPAHYIEVKTPTVVQRLDEKYVGLPNGSSAAPYLKWSDKYGWTCVSINQLKADLGLT